MAKVIISDLEVNGNSLKGMINSLAKMMGDEVYIRTVTEVESSPQVINALNAVLKVNAVLEGVKKRKAGKKDGEN